MKNSTKRLLMVGFGFTLMIAYYLWFDIDIFEIEWHHIFMLAVVGFFTGLNVIRFVIESKIEYYQKYGDPDESR